MYFSVRSQKVSIKRNRFVADLLHLSLVFDPRPVRVGFVVGIVALGETSFRVTYFSPVSNIPLMLHMYYL
jgi:hypothetical protein